jgi:Domain of unknown function (DUF4190)
MQPMFPPSPSPPQPGWPPEGATGPAGPPPPGTGAARARETKAAAALALGVLSVAGAIFGVGLSLGLPAIVLGALAHRDIRRSGGAATGGGLATAGIFLGAVGSFLFVVWVGVVASAIAWNSPPPPAARTTSSSAVAATSAGRSGRPQVVDLHTSGGTLRAQLVAIASSAQRAGEAILVETSARSCDPCAEIELAVPDPTVQDALSKVRLLRIDVGEFRSELAGLRMNEPTVPWFYLLDARGQPRDAISADEWDDNDAENIAPVLGAFVHGKLQPRRTSWRGRTSL